MKKLVVFCAVLLITTKGFAMKILPTNGSNEITVTVKEKKSKEKNYRFSANVNLLDDQMFGIEEIDGMSTIITFPENPQQNENSIIKLLTASLDKSFGKDRHQKKQTTSNLKYLVIMNTKEISGLTK